MSSPDRKTRSNAEKSDNVVPVGRFKGKRRRNQDDDASAASDSGVDYDRGADRDELFGGDQSADTGAGADRPERAGDDLQDDGEARFRDDERRGGNPGLDRKGRDDSAGHREPRNPNLRSRIRRVADVAGPDLPPAHYSEGRGSGGDDHDRRSRADLAGDEPSLARLDVSNPGGSKDREGLATTTELEWALRRSEEELQAVLAKIEAERDHESAGRPRDAGPEHPGFSGGRAPAGDGLSHDGSILGGVTSPMTSPPLAPSHSPAANTGMTVPASEWSPNRDVAPMPAMSDFEDRPGFLARSKVAIILGVLLVGGVSIGAGIAYFTRDRTGGTEIASTGAAGRVAQPAPSPVSAAPGVFAVPKEQAPARAGAAGALDARIRVGDVSGLSGQPIALRVDLAGPGAGRAELIHFVGVPAGLHLNAGFQVQRGTWLVPASALAGLALTASPNYAGRSEIGVQAYDAEFSKAVSEIARFRVEIARPVRPVAKPAGQAGLARADAGRNATPIALPDDGGLDGIAGQSEVPPGAIENMPAEFLGNQVSPQGQDQIATQAVGQPAPAPVPARPEPVEITTTIAGVSGTGTNQDTGAAAVEEDDEQFGVLPDDYGVRKAAANAARQRLRQAALARPTSAPSRASAAVTGTARSHPSRLEQRSRDLIRRGNQLMRAGDVVGARRLFEQASRSGLAKAFLAYGRSFDPGYLGRIRNANARPDANRALDLYRKAFEGGLSSAKIKIDSLLRRISGG